MDEAVRSSRDALHSHLPLFAVDSRVLKLPAYFGSSSRTIQLPENCWNRPRKERQGILALMACVRLHQRGLLTDRLLPLTRNDIRDRIYAATIADYAEEGPVHGPAPSSFPRYSEGRTSVVYYELILKGSIFDPIRQSLNPDGRQLALVRLLVGDLPIYQHLHPELGLLSCGLGPPRQASLTREEVDTLTDFFALVMNARWKRRTKGLSFRPRTLEGSSPVGFYTVGCVDRGGEMDWEFMRRTLADGSRDRKERKGCVQSVSETQVLPAPRLWSPVYQFSELSVYVAFGPANLSCDAAFPTNTRHTNVQSYQDYFRIVRGVEVSADAPLFRCWPLWKLPSSYIPSTVLNFQLESERDTPRPSVTRRKLETVLLPKCICIETSPVSNAELALEAIILPQLLFHLERHVTAKAFTEFCAVRFPVLGQCLATTPIDDVIGLLSAKSSSEHYTYERLEWLGDAVLKLVQTDAIIKSKGLREWVSNLHEGDLDSVRSIMCSNSRLYSVCVRTGIDRFVRTKKLERGLWTPAFLELFTPTTETSSNVAPPADKVCADVIEAILGFVYHRHGIDTARSVADELQILVPWSDLIVTDSTPPDGNNSTELVNLTKTFTGYESFTSPRLLDEAFTHATNLGSGGTSSYQRLEWIGDAVLCLAARQWIFDSYPNAEPAEMVLLEEPLVANESLAFLCWRSGLHQHLRHCDPTLPGRIERYQAAVGEMGIGLWSTRDIFPKPMADLVESILGSVHCDGGFDAGQAAALRVLGPILLLYHKHKQQSSSSSTTSPCCIHHPKRRLLQFCGDLFTLTSMTESKLAEKGDKCLVWRGSRLVQADKNSHDVKVAVVRCFGINLVAVADRSASSATNRASALVLAALDANPALAERLVASRATRQDKS